MNGQDCCVRLECVPVEQDGKVCITCERDELVRDSWHMITGFLKDDRVKPATCHRNDLRGVLAR